MHRIVRLIAIVVAFGALCAPAAAHAVLEASDPAAGARLDRAPARVVLTFDEPVETALGSLRVLDTDGRLRSSGDIVHPAGDKTRVATSTPGLGRGRYVVTWRVVSADSHIVGGAYAFGVGVDPGDAPVVVADPAGAVLLGIIHFTIIASALLAIGLPLGAFVLAGRTTAAGPLEFAAWFVLAAGAFADIALRADLQGGSLGASFATRVGELRVLTIFAAATGAVALAGRARWWPLVALAAVMAAGSLALAGHAAAGALAPLGAIADALHLLAAAAWVGLIAVGIAVGPSAVLQRISPVATVAVGTILVTGIVQTIRNVGGFAAMVDSWYGRAVDAKIALLLLALVLAWSARRTFARGGFAISLRLRVELSILVAIVAVTAVLVDLPLPREAVAGTAVTAAFVLRGQPIRLTATRQDALHWSLSVAGRGLDGVDASVTETRRHVGPLAVPLTRDPAGAYVGRIAVPFAGAWRVFVSARSGDFDEHHLTIPLAKDTP